MAIGAALSKTVTYGDILDMVRLQTGTVGNTDISDTLILKRISFAVQKWAKVLNGATAPFYTTTNSVLVITGSANPYTVDMSSVSPFMDKVLRVVHVTTGGTRTLVTEQKPNEIERVTALTSINASGIFYVNEGDVLRLYKGSSFTITTATDTIEIKYYRQPIVTSVTSASYLDIPDSYSTVIADEVASAVFRFKNDGKADVGLEASLEREKQSILTAFGMTKQMEALEAK